MRLILSIFIFAINTLLTSCSEELVQRKGEIIDAYVVPGIKGIGFRDMAKIKFENENGVDTISVVYTSARLNKGDSVLFTLNIRKPRKSVVKQVIYRDDGSEAYIPINTSGEKLYQYHAIDKKPLFEGVVDYENNDSVIQQFLKKKLVQVQDSVSRRIGIYLIINKQGKASVEDVLMSDDLTEVNIKNIVNRMPLFKPGEHKGKKVKVSYLVEIK